MSDVSQQQPEPADHDEVPEDAVDTANDPDPVHGSDVTDDAGAPEPTD
ncbi:hypothetical protein AB0G04_35930 [Actinoplanes sp. NPDC023801]